MKEEVRAIVVEDEDDARELLCGYLCGQGYTVAAARNARQALELAEQRRPHCVLLDFGLPDLDGPTLARELRARHGDDLVLIGVTGWDRDQALAWGAEAAIDYVVSKPFRLEDLQGLLPPLI